MTKKKSLLLQVLFVLSIGVALISVLFLTGCSRSGGCVTNADVHESVAFDGDAYFVTTDHGNVTNQEIFDMLIASDEGIHALLNIVDDIVLSADFCADGAELDEFMENLRNDIPDLDAWMLEQGFVSEDEIIRIVTRNLLRQEAAKSRVVITDEEIEEAFELWFGDDEDADLDEWRDDIHDHLVSQQMDQMEEMFAELRDAAEFVIYNEILADAYEQYLNQSLIDIALREADQEDVATDVIARVNGNDITAGQLFAELTANNVGMRTALELIDPMIFRAQFEVDPAEVEDVIDGLRDAYGDDFEAFIASQGFDSVDELFEYLETMMLQEAGFEAEFTPTEERLRELHAEMGETISGSHILIANPEDPDVESVTANEELVLDLIEQLKEADEDDVAELFAELATEHSDCGSAAAGGDLGTWERGRMVAEFEDAIFELEVGEFTTEPVRTQFGTHIIYKTGGGEVPDFEEAREELVAKELAALQQSDAMSAWLMRIRLEANTTFTNSILQEQFESMLESFEEVETELE